MTPTPVTCPACRAPVGPEPGRSGLHTVCPSCGTPLPPLPTAAEPDPDELVTAEPWPEEENPPQPETDKPAKRRARIPAWQWAVFGVVLLAAGGLVAGVAYLQQPSAGRAGAGGENPEAADPGKPLNFTVKLSAGNDPVAIPGPLDPVPGDLADVVYLLPDDTDPKIQDPPNIFKRELIRQGLWLAAREDFGLRAPDAATGEPAPNGLPGHRRFRVREGRPGPERWVLAVGLTGAEHRVWAGTFPALEGSPPPHRQAVESAEAVSRGLARRWLEAAGHTARPVKPSDAPVPPAAEAHLARMRETDQFAAVRLLHAEVRAKGESPALLAALARGYANLGMLTEFHWSAAPTAFKARGLLYAQRLLARSPGSAAGLRARGYAAALAGLHGVAADDFAAAGKAADAPPPPDWAEAADAFAHFDRPRLAALRQKADTGLARLLQYLVVEERQTPVVTLRAGAEYLATNPECYRVHHYLSETGGVGSRHQTTVAGGEVLSRNLAARVREMPDLPRPVADALGGPDEGDVYAALRKAGAAGVDRGEPSWAVLGGLLQEVRFTQAVRRLYFLESMLAVPATADAAALLPPLRGHRLRPLIESYTVYVRADPGRVMRALEAIPIPDVPAYKARPYFLRIQAVGLGGPGAQYPRAAAHETWLYPDLAGQPSVTPGRASDGREVLGVSPHSPLGHARFVAGQAGADRLPAVERAFPDSALVQRALGERHLADKRYLDAVRCWRRSVDLSPDGPAYRKLAEAYLAAGQEEPWRETLEASLGQEDTGLEHAQTRVALAEHYMAKKDYARAEPYALAAAGSGAGWALVTAARCEEGLRNWDRAEELYRAAAGRYGTPALDWFFAARLTGKMHPEAAERAARAFVRSGGSSTVHSAFPVGRFHLITGDRAKARQCFLMAQTAGPRDLAQLFAALLADEAGDRWDRDRQLQNLPLRDKEPSLADLARLLRGWYARAVPPDPVAVDAAVERLPAGLRPDADLFVGWYFHNRGLKDRAVQHWKRCAAAEKGLLLLKTHARAFLAAARARVG